MKTPFLIFAAIFFLAGCDQDNLPRRAVAYDPKFTPAVPLIQTAVHGKPIVETFTAKVVGITDGDTIKVLNATVIFARLRNGRPVDDKWTIVG